MKLSFFSKFLIDIINSSISHTISFRNIFYILINILFPKATPNEIFFVQVVTLIAPPCKCTYIYTKRGVHICIRRGRRTGYISKVRRGREQESKRGRETERERKGVKPAEGGGSFASAGSNDPGCIDSWGCSVARGEWCGTELKEKERERERERELYIYSISMYTDIPRR